MTRDAARRQAFRRAAARAALGTGVLIALIAAGCGKGPPPAPPPPAAPPAAPPMTIAARPEEPAPAPMMLSAASDVNPDATGRPSPIVVRVYQLRADAAFAAADFFALFDEEQQTLGAGLISRDEFVLRPADARNVDVSIAGETRFVGVVAAYRDIRNAEWRGLLPTPRRGFTVTLERARVRVSAVPD